MMTYVLDRIYNVAGKTVTARELSLFARFLQIDRRLPLMPRESEVTPDDRHEFVRRISAVGLGNPPFPSTGQQGPSRLGRFE